MSIVQQGWHAPSHISDAAKIVTAKFKNLRKSLKDWSKQLSKLKSAIANAKLVLSLLLYMEEFRDLSILE